MAKKMFILGCSELELEKQELELIRVQAELYGIQCNIHILKTNDELSVELFKDKYDYII